MLKPTADGAPAPGGSGGGSSTGDTLNLVRFDYDNIDHHGFLTCVLTLQREEGWEIKKVFFHGCCPEASIFILFLAKPI